MLLLPLQKVVIKGNQRIESETILSYLPVKPGDSLEHIKPEQCLKDLFSTGYFTDVHVYQKDQTLVVEVEENPIINQVVFEGNNKLKMIS